MALPPRSQPKQRLAGCWLRSMRRRRRRRRSVSAGAGSTDLTIDFTRSRAGILYIEYGGAVHMESWWQARSCVLSNKTRFDTRAAPLPKEVTVLVLHRLGRG